eukprot:7340088-Ditylum_brightwellii.AAC.1
MAIATLQYDENGILKQEDYQIVTLGNLDPYTWTKKDCFTLIMSQLELCSIVSQAVNDKCILNIWMSTKLAANQQFPMKKNV